MLVVELSNNLFKQMEVIDNLCLHRFLSKTPKFIIYLEHFVDRSRVNLMVKELSLLKPFLYLSLHLLFELIKFLLLNLGKMFLPGIDDLMDLGNVDVSIVFKSIVVDTIQIPGTLSTHELLVLYRVLFRWVDLSGVIRVVVHF